MCVMLYNVTPENGEYMDLSSLLFTEEDRKDLTSLGRERTKQRDLGLGPGI